MAQAELDGGRRQGSVKLIAVTKAHPAAAVVAALEAGLVELGENRVEELEGKARQFANRELTWHLIGHVQSRKARRAAACADLVHSVDTLKLARRLDRAVLEAPAVEAEGRARAQAHAEVHAQVHGEAPAEEHRGEHAEERREARTGISSGASADSAGGPAESVPALDTGHRLSVLVQVNVSGESSKSGFAPDHAVEAMLEIAELPGLDVRGLMTMAPFGAEVGTLARIFGGLRRLLDQARRSHPSVGPELSMGMTSDLDVAIKEGSTMVRVGTALFGPRPT